MAANGGNSTDAAARRRRIMERGSDRLALITGRLQSIPPSPLSPSVAQSHQSDTAPCPPSISQNSDQLRPSDENTDIPSNTETVPYDVVNDIQPAVHKSKTTSEASFEPTTTTDQKRQISTSNKSQKSRSQTFLHKTLSPSRLRPAIAASQDLRASSSFTIALLVLLSYAGFPILGSNFTKNVILSQPLILLVLTNITIVAAPLLLKKAEQKESSSGALEWVMLVQTGLRALFMDCSIYSVVLVCGMPFLQKLGW